MGDFRSQRDQKYFGIFMIFWSFLRGRFEAVALSKPINFIAYSGELGRVKSIATIKLMGLLETTASKSRF